MAEGIEYLLLTKTYVRVDSIPDLSPDEKIDLATSLFDLGLLLRYVDEEDEEEL